MRLGGRGGRRGEREGAELLAYLATPGRRPAPAGNVSPVTRCLQGLQSCSAVRPMQVPKGGLSPSPAPGDCSLKLGGTHST